MIQNTHDNMASIFFRKKKNTPDNINIVGTGVSYPLYICFTFLTPDF